MPKIIIMYWQPGSCGDLVQSLLLSHRACQGVVDNFWLDDTGRIQPNLKSIFQNNFDHKPNQWYWRTWTPDDCDQLSVMVQDLPCDWFVVPTHSLDQVNVFKQQFIDCISIGITYPQNLFPFVLKNICKKVLATDPVLDQFYNNPVHQYFKQKEIFGEFVFKEQIRFGSVVRRFVDPNFDINVNLEKILVNDFSDFDSMPIKKDYESINRWLERQNHLHRFTYDIGETLRSILGFNSRSVVSGDLSVELDNFDLLAILEFCRAQNIDQPTKTLKTLRDANDFFESKAL